MRFPVAEHVVIEDCAHVIPYEQPDAFLGALRAFLARV
jgi:pimeloyl-ACP methyl ester carboxylesterase